MRGVVYIYGSLMCALVLGLISSSMTARLLTPRELGHYRFVISCVTVAVSASTLGLFSSAGSLLAAPGKPTFRRMVTGGASTQAWFVTVIAGLCVAIVLATNRPDSISAGWLVASLLGGVMAWPLLLQETLRARGSFLGLSLLNAGPPLLFIALLLASKLSGMAIDSILCSTCYFLSQGVIAALLVFRSDYAAKFDRLGYIYLFKRNINLGLNVYWGTFLAALTAQSGIFVLQAFRTPEEVGVFSLALTLTAPLALLPSTVGTVYFNQLPGSPSFPKNVIRYAWLTATLIGIGFCITVPFAIHILYGEKYISVTLPSEICGIGAILQGMGDVYNRYYLANRDTKFLLRNAFIVCVTAIVLGFAAGDVFGILGASLARSCASLVYVLSLAYYYHVARRRF
ncbi:lipopolysaccharide biosynthesis protein [Novosphingobium pituita]|nr:hypothetical protein [Novosphingobium sp. IK01]